MPRLSRGRGHMIPQFNVARPSRGAGHMIPQFNVQDSRERGLVWWYRSL
jgi:hypothetical protein